MKTTTRINEAIRAKEIRLINAEGEQAGIVSVPEAIKQAEAIGLDLVEISPTANPPVCRIMDYSKFLYEQKKKAAEAKKNQRKIQVKEVKFRPVTDTGDYEVKLRNLIRFLEHGDKAKVTIRFKGREMAHQDLGRDLMERLITDLEAHGIPENRTKLEGRQLVVVFAPKKKKA
ncbi:MAG: translation initiation factor IF-3 [Legionellales bacterium]|nr:translation initiation factor IF-3 [Legionellales bacterium]